MERAGAASPLRPDDDRRPRHREAAGTGGSLADAPDRRVDLGQRAGRRRVSLRRRRGRRPRPDARRHRPADRPDLARGTPLAFLRPRLGGRLRDRRGRPDRRHSRAGGNVPRARRNRFHELRPGAGRGPGGVEPDESSAAIGRTDPRHAGMVRPLLRASPGRRSRSCVRTPCSTISTSRRTSPTFPTSATSAPGPRECGGTRRASSSSSSIFGPNGRAPRSSSGAFVCKWRSPFERPDALDPGRIRGAPTRHREAAGRQGAPGRSRFRGVRAAAADESALFGGAAADLCRTRDTVERRPADPPRDAPAGDARGPRILRTCRPNVRHRFLAPLARRSFFGAKR